MIIVLLGAPGVGKGTQSEKITNKYKIVQISTGDILRNEVKNSSDLGLRAKSFMDKGELVPDQVIIEMMKKRIKQSDCRNGFLLDGFPRTIDQAKSFNQILETENLILDGVIYINVNDNEIIERLTLRRICPTCGAIYHLKSKPPKLDMVCDICGSTLMQRSDDNEETVKNRLRVFKELTQPLIDYYARQGKLSSVDGEGSVEDIFTKIVNIIERK